MIRGICKQAFGVVLITVILFACTCFTCWVAFASGEVAEGSYTIEVSLSGGSGKASVESPARVDVAADGTMMATLVWSSSNYDLMVVDGAKFTPVSTENGSTFEVPVAALDEAIAVKAETTAMSQPHMIDYSLTFDSSTMKQVKSSGLLAVVPLVVVVVGNLVCIVAIFAILWAIRAVCIKSGEGSE